MSQTKPYQRTVILLLMLIFSCSACTKKTVENVQQEISTDTPNQPVIPISTQTLPSSLQLDYSEDKGQIRDNRVFFPLKLMGDTFEYTSGSDLIRFDLISHKKTVYPDVFDYSWCNRNNNIIFQENENWILSDEENYYCQHSEYWENTEDYRLSKKPTYLICKDRKSFQQKWKILISDDDNYYSQRIIQNQDSIFVFIRKSLSMKCIDKKTGQLKWHFQAQKILPYIGFPDQNRHANGVLATMKVRLIHQFGDYLVIHFYALDTRKPIQENPFFEETGEIICLLSLDGQVIRIIPDAIAFYQDKYLYRNEQEFGMKQVIDGKILWSKPFSEDQFNEEWKASLPVSEEVKPFFLTESYLVQYVISEENDQSYTSLRCVSYTDGSVVWTKTLPFYLVELKEHKRRMYILGSNTEYTLESLDPVTLSMMVINPFTSELVCFPIQIMTHGLDTFAYEDFQIISEYHHTYICFRKGNMTIADKQFVFNPNVVVNQNWTVPDYWDLTVLTHDRYILTVYTNDEENGGGYMVFKTKPFNLQWYHQYE